jgi:predicted phosphoribosyltransferase
MATGSAMRAAVLAVRRLLPARVVVAMPELFSAVGLWYIDFSQTTDEDVRRLLSTAPRGRHSHAECMMQQAAVIEAIRLPETCPTGV